MSGRRPTQAMSGLLGIGTGKAITTVGWKVAGRSHVMVTAGYRINGNVRATTGVCMKGTGIDPVSGALSRPANKEARLTRLGFLLSGVRVGAV